MDIKNIKLGIQKGKKNIKEYKIKNSSERSSKILYYQRRIRDFKSKKENEKLIREILLAYYDLSKTTFWELKMQLKDVPEVDKVIKKYIKN